ncbi:aminotransferase [Kineococcus rhizosphaerae]|uniref:4-aminobutyrate aminotransferase-like enzyme n=1 Tax=Kineococcus rhizosphaerae TaxID=559628 RepID=A0A2T0RBI5_9ACTN|nr:aminotransferase [Kineococcus rhizosphaerae]PRY18525.1 4-aminobutyrate aminotransferase-like enzyme [Kineococcus rhizosphaerae]
MPDTADGALFDFFTAPALPAPDVPADELTGLVAREFGLRVRLRSLGSQQDQNFTAHDLDDDEPVAVLKISNPAFSAAEIDLQDRVAALLARELPDLRVGHVLRRDGRDLAGWFDTSRGRLHLRLLTVVHGRTLHGSGYLAPAVVERLGSLAAAVSGALEHVEDPAGERVLQWDLQHARRVVELLAPREPDPAVRERVLTATASALAVLEPLAERLPAQLGHFDLTDDNVVVAPGGRLPDGIVDFGDVLRSWRVGELAVTISSVLHHAGADARTTLPAVRAFDAVRSLTEEEVEALWPLVVLRGAVLVLSGRDQAVLDPTNAYAQDGLDREWRILEQAVELPLPVVTALVRNALGRSRPAPAPLTGTLLPAGTRVDVLDAGTRSPLNDLGAWTDPGTLEREARRRLRAGTADVVVLPHAVPVLTGSPTLSTEEPATVPTGVTLWAGEPFTAPAPFAGGVRPVDGGVELTGAEGVLRLSAPGLGAVEGAARAEPGRPFATVPAGRAVHVQVVRDPALVVPARVRAGHAPGWLAQVHDPAPLLGLVPAAPPTSAAEVLARRGRVLAEVQEHYYAEPPQVERGWREHLADVDGRVYLDVVNNVTSVGHAHPRIEQAAHRQLRLLNTNSRFHYAAVAEFAEKIAATLPDELDTVFLVNSGSEAVDLALRIAMAATGRRHVVAMREAYHGWTFASDAVSTSIADNPNALATRPDWVHTVDAANSYRGRHRGEDAHRYAPEAVATIRDLASRVDLAGFVAETYFGNAGGVALPPGYLREVYAAVREAGGLAVADEVQVGYGRLGHWFWGFQQQGVVPDVVAVAKSVGNGFPLGAVVTRREVADRYRTQGYFFSSTGGSPLSSVVGSTVLDVIADERLQENAAVVGGHLEQRLTGLAGKHELIGAVHGDGLYLGVEFVRDRGTLEPATAETAAICDRLLELGVVVQPTGDHQNVLKVKPPLCIARESVDFFVDALDRVLVEGW